MAEPKEVVIDGVRYAPVAGLLDEPDMPDYDKWIPAVGDQVWSNFDSGPPMGRVVGYLNSPGSPRHGQPVIEAEEDSQLGFLGRKKGDRFICHPHFMWPFCPGSPEHQAAKTEGRFG